MIQTHVTQSHLHLGTQQETVGLAEVFHHPQNRLPYLNYVTPRRNTAWVPAPEIKAGLEHLRSHDRRPRVYYFEGLYPPVFAKTLRDLGLVIESETGIMTYKIDLIEKPRFPRMPVEMRVEYPEDQQGIALWWYVWRNARYDVVTHGTEPLYVGRDMRETTLGHQRDIIVYRYGFPVAVARLTFHQTTAHLSALAVMKEVRSVSSLILMHQIAIFKAAERGAALLFASGETEDDRKVAREIGFVDSGSIVCYAEPNDPMNETTDDSDVAEPIFVLR
jgi:hypothetical protein